MAKRLKPIEKHCMQCGKRFMVHHCTLARGYGKFCSVSCSTTYRNITNNPTRLPGVKEKISINHADVKGKNNPMYGKSGKLAPRYIDGRDKHTGEPYRKAMLANKTPICKECGESEQCKLHVHHIDGNHKNNSLDNLQWLCVSCHNNIYHKRERDALGRFTSARKELM